MILLGIDATEVPDDVGPQGWTDDPLTVSPQSQLTENLDQASTLQARGLVRNQPGNEESGLLLHEETDPRPDPDSPTVNPDLAFFLLRLFSHPSQHHQTLLQNPDPNLQPGNVELCYC